MKRVVLAFLFALLVVLVCHKAHAGRITGTVSLRASQDIAMCDTLRLNIAGIPHMVHGRIMRGTTKVWEDSVASVSGAQFGFNYPTLAPATYDAITWTTRPYMVTKSCPEAITWTVEPKYTIIYGWNTVGAVFSVEDKRVIGMAEMLRRLQACDSLGVLHQ